VDTQTGDEGAVQKVDDTPIVSEHGRGNGRYFSITLREETV